MNEALPEIEARQVGEIRGTLHHQRAVEPQSMAQLSDLLGGRTFGDQQQCRVAGKSHDKEDEGQHAECGDDGLANATGEVPDHGTRPTRWIVMAATACP